MPSHRFYFFLGRAALSRLSRHMLLLSPLAALRSHARMSGLSDAVGGVHGGKYQFGPRGDAGFVRFFC